MKLLQLDGVQGMKGCNTVALYLCAASVQLTTLTCDVQFLFLSRMKI